MKKTLSFVLTLLMLVTTIIAFVPNVEAEATTTEGLNINSSSVSGSEFTNFTDLAKKLDTIFSGNVGLFSNSSKTIPVNVKLGTKAVPPGEERFWYYKTSDGKTHGASGYSCFSYAVAAYCFLYDGQHAALSLNSNHQSLSAAKKGYITYNNFIKWGVRDDLPVYIRIGVDNNDGHSIIVLTYDKNHITYLDGNGDRQGLIAIRKEPWKNVFGSYSGSNIYARPIISIIQPQTTYYPICDCEELNQYNDDGTCSNCGRAFDWESMMQDVKGIYGTTKSISPSSTPYKATASTSVTFKAGTAVEVLGKCTNAFGNAWYKISYGNGEKGYLFESNLKEVAPTVLPSYVMARSTVSTEVMSLPCSTKTNSTSYKVAVLNKGEIFDVTQIVENISGNFWYKVITAAGDEGWVWCEETKVSTFNKEPSSIIIGDNVPSTIPKAGRHVDYKIQTSYSNIRTVVGAIYNGAVTSGNAVCSHTLDAGHQKYVSLYGTALDNALTFGSLTEGKQYTLVITANLAYGYYDYDEGNFASYQYPVTKSWTFTVKSSGDSCSHSYSSNYSTDETNHWKVCTKCGSSSSLGAHSYDNSCDTSCNICSATRSITHTYSFECDELCNICGAERTVYDSAHSYKYTYLDERKHTEECTMCGRKTEILHHPGTNVLKYTHYNSNQHWFLCKNCEEYFEYSNHYYSNSCDETCNGCDYTRTISHTYSNGCDSSCNVCGATRATSHEYDNVCDTSCNNCGYSRPTSHTYDNNCDGECNVCGATRSVSHSYGSSYLSDNNMHWRQCNSCGYKGYSENHIPGAYATETNPQICIICSFVIQPPLGHITHNYSSQYQKNDSQHWYECICGSKKDIQTHQYDNDCDNDCNTCGYVRSITHVFSNACDAKCNKCEYTREIEHAFDNGRVTKEPTTNENGEITYVCTLCGEKKYQDIDVLLGGNDNLDDNKPVVGETPNDDKNLSEGVDMPTVIAISVSVAAVTAMGTALLIRRKNPKPKVVESNNSKEDNIEESISEESESNDGTK